MNNIKSMPAQKLSYSKKNKDWRKQCIDWIDKNCFLHSSHTRKSYKSKTINYDLVNGILDMEDVQKMLNPDQIQGSFIPKKIEHYPIINSKLNIIKGEEWGRKYDGTVIVTNPDAITEIERNKMEALMGNLEDWITQKLPPMEEAQSEEEAQQLEEAYQKELSKVSDYFKYNWKDIRELRSNYFLKHYYSELDMALKFNAGIMDAMVCGEEIYQCDIIGGEPTMERLNPRKIQVIKSGFSNRIEDADVILYWDYWSAGRIQDAFYDVLKAKDVKRLSEGFNSWGQGNSFNNGDYNDEMFYPALDADGTFLTNSSFLDSKIGLFDNGSFSNIYDGSGNIRVLRVYWKSYRKIKKVKSYNIETGEEEFEFYPEDYVLNKDMGEEEEIFYINEAWEGTKIGKDIYVNMRPRIIQYNRLENPSKCHFGIIGSIYNLNETQPFSFVDMMKQYAYLYNICMDNMLKVMATNWGKILNLDLASVPSGWDMDKWLYYAKINKIAVKDSFKEGNKGASTGKVIGNMNSQNSGAIDASQGDTIQYYVQMLNWITETMSNMIGITKQREGAISNRETVGGVERAVLQSSHITEWLFLTHDNVKKRVLECFIETAKIAMQGQNKKFQHVLSDGTIKIIDIDGEEFAECDYGLVIQDGRETQEIRQKLEGLAQTMMQNQMISASSLIKLYTSSSLAEITRTLQQEEMKKLEQMAEQAEAEQAQLQEDRELQANIENEKLRLQEEANIRDNETKAYIAELKIDNTVVDNTGLEDNSLKWRQELDEKKRQFNERLAFDKNKAKGEHRLKEKAINSKQVNRVNK